MLPRRQYDDPAVIQASINFRVQAETSTSETKPWEAFEPPDGFDQQADAIEHRFQAEGLDQTAPRIESGQQVVGKLWVTTDQQKAIDVRAHQIAMAHYRGEAQDRPGWPGWEALCRDALDAWGRFRRVVPEAPLTYLGVRYVNRFDLPRENLFLGKYFRTMPNLSADAPGSGLSDYFLQLELPQDEQDAHARLIQTSVESSNPDRFSIILDIDVFRQISPDEVFADNNIKAILEQLHAIENAVFESALTNDARELMQPDAASKKSNP